MSLCRSSRLLLARFPATPIVRIPSAIRHNTTTTTTPAQRTSASPSTNKPPTPATNSAAVTSSSESETPSDSVTNAFSPVTTFPQDHDPNEVIAAAIVSGAPIELQSRTVRIYKPAKPATQSGNWNGRQWRMDWDVLPKGHRWENPLMGWQSSGDYMQGTHIFFKTKEDAIRFADKQGYDWFVQEPKVREFRVKSYAANFLHSPNKLKVIRTK